MAKQFTGYQKKVIDDYYKNIDKIALAKLQDLVTEIYLAPTAEKKSRLWKQVAAALKKLQIKDAIAQHILKKQDPLLLAKNINDWLKN